MIERLQTTMRALCELPPDELLAPEADRLRRDCADALRLELDCRQLSLGTSERAALQHLSDLLEEESGTPEQVALALNAAAAVLGAPGGGAAPPRRLR